MKSKQSYINKTLGLLLLLGVLAMASCQTDPLRDLSDEDSQVLITNYDKSVRFGDYRTFGIVDSVYFINNNRVSRSITDPEVFFIDYLASKLTQRGFERVARSARPDLGVNVARIRNSSVNAVANPIFDPFFWNSTWGFGGGFSPFYPSYYSFVTVSETYWYIEIADLRNASTSNNRLRILWNAELRGNGIFETDALARLIDAALAQSVYLKR
jgi:hypothetical protein